MKIQQLRYLTEIARRGLNVSEAAEALHTSQPGVSKQIRAPRDVPQAMTSPGISVMSRETIATSLCGGKNMSATG